MWGRLTHLIHASRGCDIAGIGSANTAPN